MNPRPPEHASWPAAVRRLAWLLLAACSADVRRPSAGDRLADALVDERVLAGRLADARDWRPCPVVDSSAVVPRTRCGTLPTPGTPPFARLARATDDVRRGVAADSSPAMLRTMALAELRWRDASPGGLERAAEALARARERAPHDAAVLNDVAATQLALAERDQQLLPMLHALDAVEHALARDPAFAPALFNRALVLERLYLVASARRAWTRYLAVERDPAWRAEAAAHLRGITAGGAPSTDARRECFAMLGAWGAAVGRGDAVRATRQLDAARAVAAAVDPGQGDRGLPLAVRAIDEALAAAPRRALALARAHVALADGLQQFSDAAYERALPTLDRAERELRAAGSPAARWAGFYRAAALVSRGEYEDGDRAFARVRADATPAEPALIGKALLALGVSQVRRGNYERAIARYREAAPFLERAREPETAGQASLLLADGLALAGQSTASRAEAYRGLRRLAPFRGSNYLNNTLALVAADARAQRLSYAALAVMGEVLQVADSLGRADVHALALRERARDLLALGRSDAAGADLAEAARWADRMPAGRGRDRIRAAVLLAHGQIVRATDPRAALPLLDTAVTAYRSFGTDFHLPAALHEAALAALASGDAPRARRWLDEAIAHVEGRQATFQTAAGRAAHVETVENVFDAMIALLLDDGDAAGAFAYLERARIAAWAPTRGPSPARDARSAVAGPAAAGARLPSDMLLVEYALLRDRLVVWTASRRGWRAHAIAASRDSVAALVDRLHRELGVAAVRDGDARVLLFDLLLRPIESELAGIRRIAVVADRELHRVPFVALWDRERGRYAVERFQFRTAPSAAFLLAVLPKGGVADHGSSALVVGDPALDAATASRLVALPGAVREARRVAALYPGATLLTGAAARRDAVVAQLARSRVLHFAGHAVFNSDQPELSYLALAPDGATDDGALRAWEVGALRLSHLQVVVLSACSTLNPRSSRPGAVAGLAYSFLRAGAPATVSTLWDVTDLAVAELLVEFHRRLGGRMPAAEALRQAQLHALTSPDALLRAPRTWAAFTYTGS